MKKLLLLFIAITGLFAACRRTIACRNAGGYELQFYTPSLADTIYDTSALIVKFAKGSNFHSQIDTIAHIALQNINVYAVDRYAQKGITYTPYSGDIYNTDILIVLYPSGRSYRITKMEHDNKTMTEKNSDHYACSDNINYLVNDTAASCAGQIFTTLGGGDAILYINYY